MEKLNSVKKILTNVRQKESGNELVFSYKTIRNLIGFGGMFLPVILALFTYREAGNKFIEPSISDYYYTSSGDVFIVFLSVISVLLFTYNGYNLKEKIWVIIAAICGIGVAFCPTYAKCTDCAGSIHHPQSGGPGLLGMQWHFIFAVIFFISLSIMSLYYFPMSDKKITSKSGDKMTRKEKRNIVFRICGWMMIGCIAVLALYMLIPGFKNMTGNFPVIFTFETIAVEAFAISWLTKGETFYPDGEHYMVSTYKEIKNRF